MKAMVLAAGLGTRLRPLTNERPKALVEVAGRTLLDITLARLRSFGIRNVIINVHHFADLVIEYLKSHDNFGMNIAISREDILLDTGGGLKKAAWFFLNDDEPFILHNVDVISTIDLARMLQFHREHNALATLAVQDRATARYLLFNNDSLLCGRRAGLDGAPELFIRQNSVLPHLKPGCPTLSEAKGGTLTSLAFSGIHAISPRLLPMLTEEGAFPIVPAYLRLVSQGEPILAFRADEYYWRDLGKPEQLEQTADDVRVNKLTLV